MVIYEENHSFDNLYGGWEGVNGLANADAAHTTQVNQAGNAYTCLKQDDVNLTSPPLAATCTDSTTAPATFTSAFTNAPFQIDDVHPADGHDVPAAARVRAGQRHAEDDPSGAAGRLHARPRAPLLPGAVPAQRRQPEPLRDRQRRDRPDAWATTTPRRCRSTSTCTRRAHPHYAIADNFFQAAFGGSFLNHQWLVAAASPVWNAALERRVGRRPALRARRERDAEQLPAVRVAARRDR